jgi:adenylylsulfate kinase-like enzyme
MVIWLLGISGSGKTTLGSLLKKHFDSKITESYLVDGDIVRSFFDNDLGYGVDERRQNIKRILFAAHVLEQNGVIPIVCNISPFEDLRQFARNKFYDYVQIYLQKSIPIAQKNDVKNIYRDNLKKTPIAGIDLVFDEPLVNELVIAVDSESVDTSFAKIMVLLSERNQSEA